MIRNTEPNIKKFSLLKPKNIIFISVVLVVLLIASTIYEYNANKNEIYHMLGEYANSMIYLVSKSSENSIVSDSEMENLLAQHLLGVAKNVARLDSLNKINDNLLTQIGNENEVFRINIFNQERERIFSNANQDSSHHFKKGKYSPDDYLAPIYEGKENEIVIGLKEARLEKGTRYAVAVRRTNKDGVIVVNLDAESFISFKNKIGFGKLILDIGAGTGTEYVVLQSPEEILAANKNVDDISNFNNDAEIKNVYETGKSFSRVIKFGGADVFETVSLFKIDDKKIGVFRVGLSMDEVTTSETRMLTRTIIVSLLVIIITVIVLSVIISNQNYNLVSEQYKKIQTFTGNILENLSLALITIDTNNNILIFNRSAFEILSIPFQENININSDKIKNVSEEIYKLLTTKISLKNFEIETNIYGNVKTLMLNSVSPETINNNAEIYSLLIEDITEMRKIEKQLSINEKFSAMGELASGVAHEIRNPLNTINMISQRFEREYKKKINSEDFNTLTEILHTESQRVNSIIEQFLRFTKPAKLTLTKFKVSDFIDEIRKIGEVQSSGKNISIICKSNSDLEITMDYQQMKQVFINLIRNAIDSITQEGIIKLEFRKFNEKNVFTVSDTGKGISKEELKKIFDIYYTTKSNGTGMGLSIARQIVLQHNGTIDAESEVNKGTKFTITIP